MLKQALPLFVKVSHKLNLLDTHYSPVTGSKENLKHTTLISITVYLMLNCIIALNVHRKRDVWCVEWRLCKYLLVTMMFVFLCPGNSQCSLKISPSSCLISDLWTEDMVACQNQILLPTGHVIFLFKDTYLLANFYFAVYGTIHLIMYYCFLLIIVYILNGYIIFLRTT